MSVGANCHVDACMGGFVLPFAEMLGRPVAPWDFRVEGVTTISADIHKLGYAPKGVSVILHRTKESRRFQTFVFDDWLGGFYASPNMQGTRSGLPMACAWAVMSHLGIDGYVELTRQTLLNADQLRAGIAAIDGIRVLGDGSFHLVATAADPESDRDVDVFALGDALARERLVPRPADSAGQPALDGEQHQHRRDRRLPRRSRRMRRPGRHDEGGGPLDHLRHAGVIADGRRWMTVAMWSHFPSERAAVHYCPQP